MVTSSYIVINLIVTGSSPIRPLFYIPYHFSELQSCKSVILTDLLSVSYLNSAQHFSVIELCREPYIYIYIFTVLEKINLQFFAISFLAFFNNVDFRIYFSRYITVL